MMETFLGNRYQQPDGNGATLVAAEQINDPIRIHRNACAFVEKRLDVVFLADTLVFRQTFGGNHKMKTVFAAAAYFFLILL